MADVRPQSYEHHTQRLPLPFLLASLVLAANVVVASANLVRRPSWTALLLLLLAVSFGVMQWYLRRNAQIVQDRVIRLEERLRLERLLPPELAARIHELSLRQLIALRFASDAEVAGLVRQVLEEGITDPDQIKRRVRDWRADFLRV